MKRYQKILWLLAYVLALNSFTGQVRLKIIDQRQSLKWSDSLHSHFSWIQKCDMKKPCEEIGMNMWGDSALTIRGDTVALIRQALIMTYENFKRQMKGVVIISDTDTTRCRLGDTIYIFTPIPLNKRDFKPKYAKS